MKQTIVSAALGAAMVGALALAPTGGEALAQQQQYQQQQQPGAAQVSEEHLRAYAAAAVEVQEIGAEYQPRVDGAASPEEAEALRADAQDEMIEAVQSHGLSVEEYNEIFTLAQADPQIRQQVEHHMMEMQ